MHQQLGDNSKFDELTFGQNGWNDFSPLLPQNQTELPLYNAGSPFPCDFGNESNAFHFQDGTCEQDIFLSDLLDEVFNNQDEFSYAESTSQKNSVVGSDTLFSGQMHVSQAHTDAEMAQIQVNKLIFCVVWATLLVVLGCMHFWQYVVLILLL